MKIVSFINLWQRDVIDKILAHCGLSSRAPPPPDDPHAEPLQELRYKSDEEFVQDPGPAEPAWNSSRPHPSNKANRPLSEVPIGSLVR